MIIMNTRKVLFCKVLLFRLLVIFKKRHTYINIYIKIIMQRKNEIYASQIYHSFMKIRFPTQSQPLYKLILFNVCIRRDRKKNYFKSFSSQQIL